MSLIHILLILSILLVLKSYLLFREKTGTALLLLFAAGFIIRLFCSLDPFPHIWDERYHALVAKNLMLDPFEPKLYFQHVLDFDYKNWTNNLIWLHKQPLPLWIMALSMKIFSVDEIFLRLPSVIFSSLSILLTYHITVYLFSKRSLAFFAAFLQCINGLVIELASGRVATDHIDTYFLFFVELSIFLILKNRRNNKTYFLVFAGISVGLAVLCKWLPALISLILYVIINYNIRSKKIIFKEAGIITFFMALIVLPWQIYAYLRFPNEYIWERFHTYLHFTTGLEGHGQPWYYFLDRIRININEIIYLPLIWLLFNLIMIKERLYREFLFIAAWIFIPLLVFSTAQTKMQGYILFTYPAYFILIALFLEKIGNIQTRFFKANHIRNFLLCITIIFAVRYSFERIKPFEDHSLYYAAKRELINANFPSNAVIFNAPCPIEIMFYNKCIAYSATPDANEIDNLIKKGFKIYLVKSAELNTELSNNKDVEMIHLDATLQISYNR